MFIISLLLGTENMDPSTCSLYTLGAKVITIQFTPDIVRKGHLHRLFIPALLHGGYFHILVNLFFQLRAGFLMEKYYTTQKFAVIYIACAFGGSLLSACAQVYRVSVGASTALFGILGLYGCYFIYNWFSLGPGRNLNFLIYIFMVVTSFSISAAASNVDLAGHAGGFVTGVLIGLALLPDELNKKWGYIRWGSLLLWSLLICALAINLGTINFTECDRFGYADRQGNYHTLYSDCSNMCEYYWK